jgi:hypothetical protein
VLNLISGQTHGATPAVLAGVTDNGSVYGDADPTYGGLFDYAHRNATPLILDPTTGEPAA